jgi:hypothetical protein
LFIEFEPLDAGARGLAALDGDRSIRGYAARMVRSGFDEFGGNVRGLSEPGRLHQARPAG